MEEMVNGINNRMIDFIMSRDEPIDVFWMSLSAEELQIYQKESLRVSDKETSDKLLEILKGREK